MENSALFKSIYPSNKSGVRTFLTPEGIFKAVLNSENNWDLYKCLTTKDKLVKTVKCSERARNKTLYKAYILN